jgi:hypothetical protein
MVVSQDYDSNSLSGGSFSNHYSDEVNPMVCVPMTASIVVSSTNAFRLLKLVVATTRWAVPCQTG